MEVCSYCGKECANTKALGSHIHYMHGRVMIDLKLASMVDAEIKRGINKWGEIDKSPEILLNAAIEELGEVAHAINHQEGEKKVAQEIAETMGILTRLYYMCKHSTKNV